MESADRGRGESILDGIKLGHFVRRKIHVFLLLLLISKDYTAKKDMSKSIKAGLSHLTPEEQERLSELIVFPTDEAIPDRL